MGLLITLGVVADLLFRLPVFTVSSLVFLTLFNGVAHKEYIHSIFVDGFYTTIWSFSYYLGALYGGLRMIFQR